MKFPLWLEGSVKWYCVYVRRYYFYYRYYATYV
jgi:hypothetical protein